MFHCIAEGEARKGVIVCKPGGRDWVTGRGMVKMDKSANAGEVVYIGGLGG